MSLSCPHCGAALKEGSRLCPACGLPIPEADADAADVFVLKPGSARLDWEDAPEQETAQPKGAPEPPAKAAETVQTAPEEPPAAAPESAPVVGVPALTRREKRAERKAQRMEKQEEAVPPPPEPVKKSHWKARLLSLLIVILLLAALVGALFVYQKLERAAFAPIESAYASLSTRSSAALEEVYYPELYRALDDLGYLDSGGEWTEQLRDWQAVYGASFTAEPTLSRVHWIRGEEKSEYLHYLETEYVLAAQTPLLLKLDYTVRITATDADASVRKSAYVAYDDGNWYLMQEAF